MAIVELIMPRMGESIIEATVISWYKKEGDKVEEDETVLEVATDKVDSEVPSPATGIIKKILFEVDSVVPVGNTLALIETEGSIDVEATPAEPEVIAEEEPIATVEIEEETLIEIDEIDSENDEIAADLPSGQDINEVENPVSASTQTKSRFYSPLIRTIAKSENISKEELDTIVGTGPNNRVVKEDLFSYVNMRNQTARVAISHPKVLSTPDNKIFAENQKSSGTYDKITASKKEESPKATPQLKEGDEIIEMDRMRRLIADHMVRSKHESPHVTSVVEADVTAMVLWRNKVKDAFFKKHNEKITFSHLFAECVAKALKDYPMVNGSISGDSIIVKKNLNIGIATALESGNLIVPVIKNCEELNLLGITKRLNDLTSRARANKLKPDEVQGGTFTISNMGIFDNLIGTPIIYQPQLAILALGAIKKKAVVQETDQGDIIAIRHMMYLSLSYDHRVIDGYLGGSFLKRIAEYIEDFNTAQDF